MVRLMVIFFRDLFTLWFGCCCGWRDDELTLKKSFFLGRVEREEKEKENLLLIAQSKTSTQLLKKKIEENCLFKQTKAATTTSFLLKTSHY